MNQASLNDLATIGSVLRSAKTIAVVGCSPNPARPSNSISRYLQREGYRVIPVNPGHAEILGVPCYPDLASIPPDVVVDVVDVFRRSELVGPVADAALLRPGVKLFFMQDGVEDEVSAAKLRGAGIAVAMDRCIYRDHAAFARSVPR